MYTCVISASTRANSQSIKIANFLERRLQHANQDATVLDLSKNTLPIFEDLPEEHWLQTAHDIKASFRKADGFVFVTPEWNGMVSVGLLNLFHYMKNELAHKPVLLVGISATRGGSYPILQLRGLGYKNKRFVPIPEQLVITDCKNVFNDDNYEESAPDIYLKKRADYALQVLMQYEQALASIRASGIIDFETYPNGM